MQYLQYINDFVFIIGLILVVIALVFGYIKKK